jgi:hypothetical protein
MRRILPIAFAVAVFAVACGGHNDSPTSPTQATTKIINVSGDLAFGSVNIGQSPTRTFTISNSGNTTLTFTAINAIGGTGTAGITAAPTTGTVAPNGSAIVTLQFTPAVAQFYSAVITVVSDATNGNGAINFSGTGINNNPLFTMSGTGNTVFTMPAYVQKLEVTATYTGKSSNFIVWIGNPGTSCSVTPDASCRLLINTLLGTLFGPTTYDSGTIQTGGGGQVSVSQSDGVSWAMTEVR